MKPELREKLEHEHGHIVARYEDTNHDIVTVFADGYEWRNNWSVLIEFFDRVHADL